MSRARAKRFRCYVPAMPPTPPAATVVAHTVDWVREFVIGEGLCPFAGSPLAAGQIRFTVSQATTPTQLLGDLNRAVDHLRATAPKTTDTTLLIHPEVLTDYRDYLDFLDLATTWMHKQGYDGELQLASFHPNYQFAGTPADDPAHATNRSPYPMLHLLREASVTRAVASHPNPEGIWQRNVDHLRELARNSLAARGE